MKQSTGPRKTANLSKSVNHQLNMYALAASAAGVGVLAFASSAEARIIYTPKHVNCWIRTCNIDLLNEHIPEFQLILATNNNGGNGGWNGSLAASGVHGSESVMAVPENGRFREFYAVALRAGAHIGSGTNFQHAGNMAGLSIYSSVTTDIRGPWANGGKGVKDRYLGLKFYINGDPHFGWARFNLSMPKGVNGFREIRATLTGYAFETVPNKPIIAGKTKGPDVITVQPATLGHLAHGAAAIPAWRAQPSAH